MKKGLLVMFFLLGLVSTHASDPAVVFGTWDRGVKIKDSEVKLYRVLSGRLDEIASCKISDNKYFGFAFESQGDGFYVIGSGTNKSIQGKYVFYFKPGDRLNISVNDSSYVLIGKNSPENTAMAQWHNEVALLEYKSLYPTMKAGYINGQPSTYVDFFPLLSGCAEKAGSFRSNTGNPKFDAVFRMFRNYDLLRYAYWFILTPRMVQPVKDDLVDFYTKTDIAQLTATDDLLRYPFGIQLLQSIFNVQGIFSGKPIDNKQTVDAVKNNQLKGEWTLALAEKMKTYTELQQFNSEYGKYIQTSDQKDRINELLVKLDQGDSGLKTLDFSGTDVNDKKVSLSDFKGKVVVVDVWATWCGPCRKEIPALKALEKEYHTNTDIVFLSISLDNVKDKQKWLDFIKQEGLTGVQLFGGNGLSSEVAKLYNIKGIPRFMVFGKNGNIVTDNAPLPTNPSLRIMVEEQLKK